MHVYIHACIYTYTYSHLLTTFLISYNIHAYILNTYMQSNDSRGSSLEQWSSRQYSASCIGIIYAYIHACIHIHHHQQSLYLIHLYFRSLKYILCLSMQKTSKHNSIQKIDKGISIIQVYIHKIHKRIHKRIHRFCQSYTKICMSYESNNT